MSAIYFIDDTSIYGLTIVRVDRMTIYVFSLCCQYQFFYYILLSYSVITTISYALLTFPSVVMSSFNVNAYEIYFTTQYPSVVGSATFVAPHFPVCTNDTILALIPLRTTLLNSSNYSLDIGLFWNWIMFHLLKLPNTYH